MANEWDAFPAVEQAKSSSEWDAFPTVETPGRAEDYTNSAVSGLKSGAAGTVGAVGDIRHALGAGATYLGLSPETKQIAKNAIGSLPIVGPVLANAPDSQQTSAVANALPGAPTNYQPAFPESNYIKNTAAFAPAALGGPGGIGRRVLTQVVAPAITSEAAGQLTQGSPAEPFARAGTALLTGAAGGAMANRLAAPKEILPTSQQARQAGSDLYNHSEVAAVQFTPESINKLASDINSNIRNQDVQSVVNGLRKPTGTGPSLNVGASMGAGQKVVNPAVPGAPATVADLRDVQSELSAMSTETNTYGKPTASARAAGIANQEIGRFLDNLQQPDLLAGDAQKAAQRLKEANQNWASQAKAFTVDRRITKAEQAAAGSGSGSNLDNAIRQKIAWILAEPSRQSGFTADEIAQMQKVVNGSPITNAARWIGKLGPHGALSAMANLGAASATGGITIPLSIASVLARKFAESSTKGAARELEKMILRRSALAQTPQFQTAVPYLPGGQANPHYLPPPSALNPLYSGLIAGAVANR